MLIAYVKIGLYQRLLDSALPDEPFVVNELRAYFPSALRERHAGLMSAHRLAREIVGTVVANEMVNRCGITFAFRLGEETGADDADIARAYLVAREVYGMRGTWEAIEALDNAVGADVQTGMLLETRKLVERGARWLLRNRPRPLDIARDIAHFAGGATALRRQLRDLVADSSRAAIDAAKDRLVGRGVAEELALAVASGDDLAAALDVVEVASSAGISVEEAASVYFALGESLDLHWLRDEVAALPRDNRWQALSRAALRDDLYAQLSALTLDTLRLDAGQAAPSERVEAWLAQNRIPGRPVPPDPRRPCGRGDARTSRCFPWRWARSAPCAKGSDSRRRTRHRRASVYLRQTIRPPLSTLRQTSEPPIARSGPQCRGCSWERGRPARLNTPVGLRRVVHCRPPAGCGRDARAPRGHVSPVGERNFVRPPDPRPRWSRGASGAAR